MTLSDAARAQMDKAKARRREVWDGRRPLTIPAATLVADASLVEVGWTVWSAERRIVDDPLGGVIVQVLATTEVDPDTGEVADRLGWRVRDPYRPERMARLEAAEVDLAGGVEPLDRARVVVMIRRLCRAIGAKDQRWLTASELEALADIWRLARAQSASST